MVIKFIIYLTLIWLMVLTATGCYIIKAEHEFLKFADFVLAGNIKNAVQSGGATFYVVDMGRYPDALLGKRIPLWQPIYVKDTDMNALVEWKLKFHLMVMDFKNADFQSKIAAAKADQYFKRQVIVMCNRKLSAKEKSKQGETTT